MSVVMNFHILIFYYPFFFFFYIHFIFFLITIWTQIQIHINIITRIFKVIFTFLTFSCHFI
ncbi:MAG: hypothetical protein CMF72_25585 [Mameliella sp.]|nr:hypothetical protein [Mameliella sp.]